MGKIPNSKFQAPKKIQTPNSKARALPARLQSAGELEGQARASCLRRCDDGHEREAQRGFSWAGASGRVLPFQVRSDEAREVRRGEPAGRGGGETLGERIGEQGR